MTSEIINIMTESEARALTDEVKADIEHLWTKMLRLYEGKAHVALGYSQWGDYFEAEFGQSKSHGYQLVDAAKTMRALEIHSTIVERPATEGVARALKGSDEQKAKQWDETVKKHGPKPTATQTKATVTQLHGERRPRAKDKNGAPLWENEDVLKWVGKQVKAGKTRDQITVMSAAGEKKWPVEGARLNQNSTDRCIAILKDRERTARPAPPKNATPPKRGDRRIRELNAQRKAGSASRLFDVEYKVSQMAAQLESVNLEQVLLDDEGIRADSMRDLYDDLDGLQMWMDRSMSSVIARLDEATLAAKIKACEELIARAGTPGERESAERARARLLRRRDGKNHLAA